MGDRLLAIFQNAAAYFFSTCNAKDGNPNYYTPLNYPADIEGLWTYIYYSHSRDLSRSVAFMQFGTEEARRV